LEGDNMKLASGKERVALHGMECKVAGSFDEWQEAFSLIHRSYVQAGLSERNPCGLRVTPYHLVPTTSTLIARHEGRVIGTLSLIRDNHLGIPMEQVYGREIESFRDQRVSFAEVSCLATGKFAGREFLHIFSRLMRLVAQHARFLGVQRLLIATHPRHAAFYERFMGFRQFGHATSYPCVRGAPAVAGMMDFAEADCVRPPFYDECFRVRIQREALLARPMPADIAQFFETFVLPMGRDELVGIEPGFGTPAAERSPYIDVPRAAAVHV
jgi:hypothetical protein